ncbi:hypothetical protein R1sor_024994 [Riccia sorocarpa]|uniref:Uncharacterized protein n=1 Tax=Riccia sorocarpa TaxID=122646 RepID=A0ABD3G8V0_9MARC
MCKLVCWFASSWGYGYTNVFARKDSVPDLAQFALSFISLQHGQVVLICELNFKERIRMKALALKPMHEPVRGGPRLRLEVGFPNLSFATSDA